VWGFIDSPYEGTHKGDAMKGMSNEDISYVRICCTLTKEDKNPDTNTRKDIPTGFPEEGSWGCATTSVARTQLNCDLQFPKTCLPCFLLKSCQVCLSIEIG
jgi:hypothetical protein